MFDTLLIANRGEIACRIISSAKKAGLKTVAVYSSADANAPHVALADDAVMIGLPAVSESYLRGDEIIKAALKTGAQAIHPGYGFLSENAGFAGAVEAAGLTFVGAPASAITAMGNKAGSKRLMIEAGVPCVPGYQDEDQSDDALIKAAQEIGFPIMIKAAAGGGGRGMRLVDDPSEFKNALELARSEALNAFGSDEVILEKAVQEPRHVEVQVFADTHGNYLHFGERDCSVQRRHQKIIEEAPCPVMTDGLREAMTSAAINAAKAVDYIGAGTVEFLLDRSGEFYFLEMNTRLQVEHPVTEAITGIDLVDLQLQIAQGKPLPMTQDDVTFNGHAIEVRLYAEDPYNDFLPVTGDIVLWQTSALADIRTDAGIETGNEVSPFYDPMLAKIIAHGSDRDSACQKLIAGLEGTTLLGVQTNRGFLVDAIGQEKFAMGEATTAFISEAFPNGIRRPHQGLKEMAIACALKLHKQRAENFAVSPSYSKEMLGWSSAAPLARTMKLVVDDDLESFTVLASGDRYQVSQSSDDDQQIATVEIQSMADNVAMLIVDGRREVIQFAFFDNHVLYLAIGTDDRQFNFYDPLQSSSANAGSGNIVAAMPGVVISVDVKEGDQVKAGDTLAVMEAMKMQHQINAAADGTIVAVHIKKGDQLTAGATMLEMNLQDEK